MLFLLESAPTPTPSLPTSFIQGLRAKHVEHKPRHENQTRTRNDLYTLQQSQHVVRVVLALLSKPEQCGGQPLLGLVSVCLRLHKRDPLSADDHGHWLGGCSCQSAVDFLFFSFPADVLRKCCRCSVVMSSGRPCLGLPRGTGALRQRGQHSLWHVPTRKRKTVK